MKKQFRINIKGHTTHLRGKILHFSLVDYLYHRMCSLHEIVEIGFQTVELPDL